MLRPATLRRANARACKTIYRTLAAAIMFRGGNSMSAPVVRFRIDFAAHSSVGPGKIRLLEAIRDAGSLSQGARNIGISYRRAWLLVDSLNQSFRKRVTL